MSNDEPSLAVAELRSELARQALAGTLVEIQARLNPRSLAREAVQELREAGEELARDGLEAAKRHPLTVVGVATAIILFLARQPVRALISRLPDETPAPPTPHSTRKPRTRGTPR